MTIAVGIDAGGTKLAAGRVDTETGKISDRRVLDTRPSRGGDAVLADVVGLARGLGLGATAIGIGIPEMVDASGRIRSAANWDWRDTDFVTPFEELPRYRIVSDVHAAALAEARLGAGRDRSFLYVSVGTGVSSCLVLDGEPWRGADGRALLLGAPLVESVASGPAIARAAGKDAPQQAFADPACDAVIDAAADALGLELARAVHLADPGLIVMGGGLGLNERYRELVAAAVARHVDSDYIAVPEVVPAGLGENAGIIGAALAAL